MAPLSSLRICLLVACYSLGQAQTDGPDLTGQLLDVEFSLILMEPSTTFTMTTESTTPTTESATTSLSEIPSTGEEYLTTPGDGMPYEELHPLEKRSIAELSDVDMGMLMVTDSTEYPPYLIEDVKEWLEDIFTNEYAFESLQMTTSSSFQMSDELPPIDYTVRYNLSLLSMVGGLNEDGIVHNLTRVSEYIYMSNMTFDAYVINEETTKDIMVESISEVSEVMTPGRALCDDFGLICTSKNTSCNLRAGSLQCANNCLLYNEDVGQECVDPDSNHAIIFLNGTCRLTKDGDPYCDCGMSSGDVMKNFYIEPRCVSAAFVVGMAAGLGGFLIIVFVCTVIGLSVCLRKEKDKSQHINAYSDGPKSRNKEELILDDLEKNGARASNNAYENRAYVPYEEPKDMRQELTDQQYTELRASLSHIDPKVDTPPYEFQSVQL